MQDNFLNNYNKGHKPDIGNLYPEEVSVFSVGSVSTLYLEYNRLSVRPTYLSVVTSIRCKVIEP